MELYHQAARCTVVELKLITGRALDLLFLVATCVPARAPQNVFAQDYQASLFILAKGTMPRSCVALAFLLFSPLAAAFHRISLSPELLTAVVPGLRRMGRERG
jgi:hypothetical protein